MKPIVEVYPDDFTEGNDVVYDYQPLLKSFQYEILIQEEENSYQGDTFVLFLDNDRLGVLCFGWGSCSGCDALQSCRNHNQIEELRNQLHNDIRWFSDLEQLNIFLNDFDHTGQFYGNLSLWTLFHNKCQALLKNADEDLNLLLTSSDQKLRLFGRYLILKTNSSK